MEAKTILLVEDNFLNRRFAKKILTESGYRILESKNAKEALAFLDSENIDLVILDIHLGEEGQNGISLGEQIKERYALPFIYVTAYETPEIVVQAMHTAPYSYLTKPFKNIDLIAAVEIAIRQSAHLNKQTPSLRVKDGAYNLALPIEEICHIESEGNYLLVHTEDKIYRYRSTIGQLIKLLPTTFIQTHRAFVVNSKKIEKSSSRSLVVNKKEIPISQYYKAHLPSST